MTTNVSFRRCGRGLTLVEVLAATVLLALLAAATVPLVREVGRALDRSITDEDLVTLTWLGDLADRVLAEPGKYGLAGVSSPGPIGELPVRYPPGEVETRPVTVTRLDSTDADRAWLAFASGRVRVFRDIAVQTPRQGASR